MDFIPQPPFGSAAHAVPANNNTDCADSGPILDWGMSRLDHLETERAGTEGRHALARLYQLCGFTQDLAVMRALFSGQYRQQGEHARIARRTKRQRRKRM